MRHPAHRPLIVLLTIAAACVLASAARAAEVRLSARVSEPFELNGKLFPASAIVVEHAREYTPSSSLSEVWVGSEFVGLLRADRVATKERAENSSLAFERDARGVLVLVGYTSATHGVHGEFRFQTRPVAHREPTAAVAQR